MTSSSRTAIVTGAAGTFGQAIARRLAEDQIRIAAVDLDGVGAESFAAELVNDFGVGSAVAVQVDLGDLSSLRAMVKRVGDEFGRIDILVNNAAVNRRATLDDLEVDGWDVMAQVNLRAPAFLAQAVKPYWEKQGGGSIVNIGSRSWQSGGPIAYTTVKAGIVGLTRALATELAPIGVTVNTVAPSFIQSNFTAIGREQREMDEMTERYIAITPLRRLPAARDVANAVAFLGSEQAGFITGEVLHVCGGAQLAPCP